MSDGLRMVLVSRVSSMLWLLGMLATLGHQTKLSIMLHREDRSWVSTTMGLRGPPCQNCVAWDEVRFRRILRGSI